VDLSVLACMFSLTKNDLIQTNHSPTLAGYHATKPIIAHIDNNKHQRKPVFGLRNWIFRALVLVLRLAPRGGTSFCVI
jgi:hypothetical protein